MDKMLPEIRVVVQIRPKYPRGCCPKCNKAEIEKQLETLRGIRAMIRQDALKRARIAMKEAERLRE